ncbi:hypothetical protein CDL12_01083 [Handroanthus impetiginosus]|nr:hypothetical protein CDL12_01083 [Handroanthus impetiginosus]
MDSNSGEKIPSSVQPLHHHHYHHDGRRRHHHHHHFFYISPHCPLHHSILLPKNHSPSCSFSTSYPSHQNIASIPTKPHLRFGDTQRNETFEEFPIIENGIEKLDLEEDEE